MSGDFDLIKEVAQELHRQKGGNPNFVATFHDGTRVVAWETQRDAAEAVVRIFRKYQERETLLSESHTNMRKDAA